MNGDRKVRLLIVDDSAFMRVALERMIKEEQPIEVIGSASNGREAIEKAVRLRPDVITMDIEMPILDGLHALKEIMRILPIPIIMVSSLTQNGAQATLDALDLGAVDYISKPGSPLGVSIFNLKDELLCKIMASVGNMPSIPKPRMATLVPKKALQPAENNTQIDRIVLLGASTGGPPAIRSILAGLSGNIPVPIVVAQHMPKTFTNAFAQRLNSLCNLRVKEAAQGEIIQRSVVYVCPGDSQTRIKKIDPAHFAFSISTGENEKHRYSPSIDVMFSSFTENFGRKVVGVLLTGMGDDGVKGLAEIKQAGGMTIAQDKNSCVVYGMPRAAVERGVVDRILPLNDISKEIEISIK